MIEIVAIDTPSLGDRTYLATDGTSALVVDPQRTSTGSWPRPPPAVSP
jgi:hypothetical protein